MPTSNKDLISRTLATRMMACIDKYEAIQLLAIIWMNNKPDYVVAEPSAPRNDMYFMESSI